MEGLLRCAMTLPNQAESPVTPSTQAERVNDARDAAWRCRECCRRAHLPYRYPASHDLYCSGCQQPMDVHERVAAALAGLLARLEFLPTNPSAPKEADGSDGENSELLTVAEAARLLRLSPKAVRNRIDRGQLPTIRLGRSVRIRRRHLLYSLSERRAPSPGGNRR
jgi:excisionase family DNA binding protein